MRSAFATTHGLGGALMIFFLPEMRERELA
jgi:hypothetical protein